MQHSVLDQVSSASFSLEPVLTIRVELGPEDDSRLRLALSEEIGLTYGDYDHVSFETAAGIQFFRGQSGTASGAMETATSRQVHVLFFSIPRDEAVLGSTLAVIHRLHSYEEPVVYISEAYATRTRVDQRRNGPNKWWNKNSR